MYGVVDVDVPLDRQALEPTEPLEGTRHLGGTRAVRIRRPGLRAHEPPGLVSPDVAGGVAEESLAAV